MTDDTTALIKRLRDGYPTAKKCHDAADALEEQLEMLRECEQTVSRMKVTATIKRDEAQVRQAEIERLRKALDTIKGGHFDRHTPAPNVDDPPMKFRMDWIHWIQSVAAKALADD